MAREHGMRLEKLRLRLEDDVEGAAAFEARARSFEQRLGEQDADLGFDRVDGDERREQRHDLLEIPVAPRRGGRR